MPNPISSYQADKENHSSHSNLYRIKLRLWFLERLTVSTLRHPAMTLVNISYNHLVHHRHDGHKNDLHDNASIYTFRSNQIL